MIDSRSVNKVKKKIVVDAMHAIMFVRSLQSIWLLIKKVFISECICGKCVNCGMCLNICPSVTKLPLNSGDKAYACYARNCEERLSSSSGGFFQF